MHGAVCFSPCPSRQAGRLAAAGSCPCSVPAVPSSVCSTELMWWEPHLGRIGAPLGEGWDRARTGQGQPGSPTTSTRGLGWGPRGSRAGIWCCAPVSDQSPTRDKINWEILHWHLWDQWKGRKQASPQTPETLWPPATPSGGSLALLVTLCPPVLIIHSLPLPCSPEFQVKGDLKGDLLICCCADDIQDLSKLPRNLWTGSTSEAFI